MTTPTDALELAREIIEAQRTTSSGFYVEPDRGSLIALSRALLTQAEQLGRLERVCAAARALDRLDYASAHNRGCGRESRANCLACDLDDALDALDASAGVSSSRARLARVEAVVQAAREWRVGRDRNIIGTAPAGGQRSATGIALIDAIDKLTATGEGEA